MLRTRLYRECRWKGWVAGCYRTATTLKRGVEMDLANLQTFCHVAETGNVSAAARLGGITPASAGSRLLTLELELGLTLFYRKRRRFQLTPAGHVLYEHAREILHLYDDAQARMQNSHPQNVQTMLATPPPVHLVGTPRRGIQGPLRDSRGGI